MRRTLTLRGPTSIRSLTERASQRGPIFAIRQRVDGSRRDEILLHVIQPEFSWRFPQTCGRYRLSRRKQIIAGTSMHS